MSFPQTRMRRLRATAALRRMMRETTLSADDLIMPLFVRPGNGVRNPIASMPGNYQFSVDTRVEETKEPAGLGVPAHILFGMPESKDAVGTGLGRSGGNPRRAGRLLGMSRDARRRRIEKFGLK